MDVLVHLSGWLQQLSPHDLTRLAIIRQAGFGRESGKEAHLLCCRTAVQLKSFGPINVLVALIDVLGAVGFIAQVAARSKPAFPCVRTQDANVGLPLLRRAANRGEEAHVDWRSLIGVKVDRLSGFEKYLKTLLQLVGGLWSSSAG